MKLKNRLIPILLYRDGLIVKSRQFKLFQTVGNPFDQVNRYNQWNLDELIYLNISKQKTAFDENKISITGSTSSGKKFLPETINIYEFIKKLSKKCFMPLTYGGGITNLKQAVKILKYGADKISINSEAYLNSDLIRDCSNEFGSQSLVVSIDYKKIGNKHLVFIKNGKHNTEIEVETWIKKVQDLGAGEILLNSIEKDGMMNGYDTNFINKIKQFIKIPLIACGGAGSVNDFYNLLIQDKNNLAASAANIFQFTENSYQDIKKKLRISNINIR